MTNKEIRRMLNRVLGISDIGRIDKEDIPEIIEHVKNNLGVRNLGSELNELAKNNIDKIERSINPGSMIKIKPEEVKKVIEGLSGILGNITPDKMPPKDISTQLRDLMVELSDGNEEEEEEEDNTEE